MLFSAPFSLPWLTALPVLAAVLVNGWTDAPNAIATVISSGTLSFRRAVLLSAGCNFLGVWLSGAVCPAVLDTLYAIADFGTDPAAALAALTAAMAAIVVWAVFAWCFGIPTSESHALTAAVTGAAAALQGSFAAVRPQAWGRVLFGLVFSLLGGALLGLLCALLLPHRPGYRRKQIWGAALLSFFHGAQDGQKFAGILLLWAALAQGSLPQGRPHVPLGLLLLVALTMALGTLLGGERIIRTLCKEMTCLPPREGFAADLGSGLCLLLATLLGLPVSTTHAKAAALCGAGSLTPAGASWTVAGRMALMWAFTFPVCFVIGAMAARLVL